MYPKIGRSLVVAMFVAMCAAAGATAQNEMFRFYDSEGAIIMYVDQDGNLVTFSEAVPFCSAQDAQINNYNFEKEWSINSGSSSDKLVRISLGATDKGKIVLKGRLCENDFPSGPPHPFRVTNALGDTVMSICDEGDLHLKGALKSAKVFYVSPTGSDSNPGTFASPFKTLQTARDYLRTTGFGSPVEKTGNDYSTMQHDVVVYLRAGRYETPDGWPGCFYFNEQNSGNNGHTVTYKAYAKETVTLDAGRSIAPSSFTLVPPGTEKIFVANLSEANIFKRQEKDEGFELNKSLWFRDLYVNGKRAVRARYPNRQHNLPQGQTYAPSQYKLISDYDTDGKLLRLTTTDVTGSGISLPFIPSNPDHKPEIILHYSAFQAVLRIQGISSTGDLTIADGNTYPLGFGVSFTLRDLFFNQDYCLATRMPCPPYHLENDYHFLDEAGEWYLDVDGAHVSPPSSTPRLFYKPKADEMNATQDAILSNVEIYYPRSSVILLIQGTDPTLPAPRAPVENLSFEGFTMEHTNWGLTADSYGFDGIVITPQAFAANGSPYGNGVSILRGHNIAIKENRLQHMGGNAMFLQHGCEHCNVIGNAVWDVSFSGIGSAITSLDPNDRNHAIRIENNYLARVGQTVHSGVAIYSVGTVGSNQENEFNTIKSNEIKNVPYTGIALGFYSPFDDEFVYVENNEISYAVNLYNDGGAIFTCRHIYWEAPLDRNLNDPFDLFAPDEYFLETSAENNFFKGVRIVGNHLHHITRIDRTGMKPGFPSLALYMDVYTAGTQAYPLVIQSNYWHDISGNATSDPEFNSDNLEAGHPLDHVSCNPPNPLCDTFYYLSMLKHDNNIPPSDPTHPLHSAYPNYPYSLMQRYHIDQAKNAHVVDGDTHYEGNTDLQLQSIVDNAGLTAEYEWIKNGLE